MGPDDCEFEVARLGECTIPSPVKGIEFVADEGRDALYDPSLRAVREALDAGRNPPCFEVGGPRKRIFFDPTKIAAGVVTCGGLCPGLNDVIRAIVMSLHYHYGVPKVYGFRYGYAGLAKNPADPPILLGPRDVSDIHEKGGTILGSSRGPQDPAEMVDTLETLGIHMLFTIGGDGTLRGAGAIAEEVERRGAKIAVVGIPKTIDNDISYVQRSFGFETAVTKAREAICAAHEEAHGAKNGIGLVKLMGRQSGFIAAYASIATGDVNFCLIPEVPFSLEYFLGALQERLERRAHAVIVVAEGAGQDLVGDAGGRDASGNVLLGDIGLFLKATIQERFKGLGMPVSIKYIDPSYMIRSCPADADDSAFCVFLGHDAVHAAMAGRTNMVVSFWRNQITHVPISLAVSKRKQVEPKGKLWSGVLASTGQPRSMV